MTWLEVLGVLLSLFGIAWSMGWLLDNWFLGRSEMESYEDFQEAMRK